MKGNKDFPQCGFSATVVKILNDHNVDFLDVNTSIEKISGDLIFKPFFKKTNTFSYLLSNSSHPNFIFKNIPKSLFIRLRRICSNINDFCYFSLKCFLAYVIFFYTYLLLIPLAVH